MIMNMIYSVRVRHKDKIYIELLEKLVIKEKDGVNLSDNVVLKEYYKILDDLLLYVAEFDPADLTVENFLSHHVGSKFYNTVTRQRILKMWYNTMVSEKSLELMVIT